VRGTAQVVYGNMNWSTVIQGVTPDMLWIREWKTVRGREMTANDSDTAQKVCALGNTVAETLFGDEDPIGKQVRIKGVPFTVIGVLEAKGRSPQGTDQDDCWPRPSERSPRFWTSATASAPPASATSACATCPRSWPCRSSPPRS